MSRDKQFKIYIPLLGEGTDTLKGTEAVKLEDGNFKVLQPENYDPEDEIWEFLPGSVVRCEKKKSFRGEDIMVAVERVA